MRRLKNLFPILLMTSYCLAQSGGLLNASRGIPQPNEGTTGTTLYSTAIVNTAGQAILSTTANTTVPVRIVIGGAGLTGNAVLASTGTLAPCTMDATLASGGNAFVIESTTTNGQCHPQTAAPATGTWVIGYLHDGSTTANSTALVHINGYIYGGSAGGSGTVSPNNGTLATPLAAYPAAGGSTTVQPMTTAMSNGSSGLQVNQLNFGPNFTSTPEIAIGRVAAYTLGLGTYFNVASRATTLLSGNPCPSGTTDISFTTASGSFCSKNFPVISSATNWVIHCVVPWDFTAGSGTATVAFGVALGTAPSSPSTWTGVIYGTGTPGTTPAIYQASTISSAGNQPVISTSLTIALGTIYSTTIDGTVSLSTSNSTSFAFYATTSTGTAAIKAGAYCIAE